MNTKNPNTKSERVQIMNLNEINSILPFLKDKTGPPRGLNRAYLWEIVSSKMMRVFYTESERFDNIFYGYYVENGVVIEDWYTNGIFYEESILELIESHPDGEILFAFGEKNIGDKFGWKFLDEIREMMCLISNFRYTDTCPTFNLHYEKEIITLLSQGWWSKDQSENFVKVTSSNPNGFSKIILDNNGRVIGFCHTMYDEGSAWINCVYINKDSRGKGHACRLVESALAQLKGIGITKVFLGVDKSNTNAIKLYKRLGFEFTDFCKWQFGVDRTSLRR